MGVRIITERFVCKTSGAPTTQELTTSKLDGLTPKAVRFVVVNGTIEDTNRPDCKMCVGLASGASNEGVWAGTWDDGSAPGNRKHAIATDRCIKIEATGAGSEGEAHFDSFITNGVKIDWDDYPNQAYFIVVTFFAGADLLAHVNFFTPPASGTKAITGIGFTPDCLILGGCDANADGSGCNFNTGYAVNGGNSVCLTRYAWTTNNQMKGGYWNNKCYAASDDADFKYSLTISSWDSDGFTINVATGTGDVTHDIFFLALELNGAASAWCGELPSPTSTGDWVRTDPGFKPQFLDLHMTSHAAASGTWYTNVDGLMGVSYYSTDSIDEYSQFFATENGANNANCRGTSDCKELAGDGTTAEYVGTLSSFDDNGWTINFTTASADADDWIGFAIEITRNEVDTLDHAVGRGINRGVMKGVS